MKGWQVMTLDQIATNLDSRRVPITKGVPNSGEYPYYGASGIVDYVADYIFEGDTLLISEDGANLLARSTPIAFPAYGKYWVNNHAHILNFENMTTQRFVELYLESIPLDDYITGAAQPKLNQKALNSIPIPVPSLHKQHHIVGILDEAFEGIATAKANAERNLQNARALFESHLQTVFADAWRRCELVRLSDLATDITDGDHLPPPKSLTGVPFITIGNIVKQTRKIDFADTFMVPYTYFNTLKPNKKPKKRDVLYTVTGSFGIPVIVGESTEFCFQRHIGLVRPKAEVNSAWLYYLLLSPQIFKQASEGATGAAQKTVSLKLLRSFEVPKVRSQQQQIAVAKLDALSRETQHMQNIYQQKLAALEALRSHFWTRPSVEVSESCSTSLASPLTNSTPSIRFHFRGFLWRRN
ncbi:restriction endonuclease subunit S [Tunturiibacter gelidoferens]|uniref:Type I restriction enzyme S subunit n=1 Tax=Tunturiibacter gelidiferens TaxID=3069689 RepID=A0A9X0QH46_9BACT|nr:restriction endonuclease subunit S [Edaphobacter lichenicola]MBB5330074.1 type I restriction enzyme S subunit [Edaphobacter lichenicola]